MAARDQLESRVRAGCDRRLGAGGDCSACRCNSNRVRSPLVSCSRASALARHRSRERRRSRISVRDALTRCCKPWYFAFQRSRLFSNARTSTRNGLRYEVDSCWTPSERVSMCGSFRNRRVRPAQRVAQQISAIRQEQFPSKTDLVHLPSLDDDFTVSPIAPGSAWLVVPRQKEDAAASNVWSYGEAYTVVLDPTSGKFLVYKDWQTIAYPTGRGNFPLWESDVLRQEAFRVLFRDWQNGADQFPDL